MLPEAIKPTLIAGLEKATGTKMNILNVQTVGGGCIHHAAKLETNKGPFFLKWNEGPFAFDQLEKEFTGISLLESAKAVLTPKPVFFERIGNYGILVMEWIESGRRDPDFWLVFASQLADLHRHKASTFGLDHQNYIGSLPQDNSPKKSWPEFFAENRIQPMKEMAVKDGLIDRNIAVATDHFCTKTAELFPDEPPSLIHGDLWSGNFLVNQNSEPVIFDPAVYYGNREIELAFTRLFGGFDSEFYTAYHSAFPLEPGFDSRVDLYNLYPLYVHLNLFGTGYLSSVQQILRKFR